MGLRKIIQWLHLHHQTLVQRTAMNQFRKLILKSILINLLHGHTLVLMDLLQQQIKALKQIREPKSY